MLRQQGWTVNSHQLTYKQGARPEPGKHLAIAEWPGGKDRADYVLFVGLMPEYCQAQFLRLGIRTGGAGRNRGALCGRYAFVAAHVAPLSCGDAHLLEAEVNPLEGGGRAIDEKGQYANNFRQQPVTVLDESADGGDGRSVLGNP